MIEAARKKLILSVSDLQGASIKLELVRNSEQADAAVIAHTPNQTAERNKEFQRLQKNVKQLDGLVAKVNAIVKEIQGIN